MKSTYKKKKIIKNYMSLKDILDIKKQGGIILKIMYLATRGRHNSSI